MREDAAANRLYVALSELRKLGLEPHFPNTRGSYPVEPPDHDLDVPTNELLNQDSVRLPGANALRASSTKMR